MMMGQRTNTGNASDRSVYGHNADIEQQKETELNTHFIDIERRRRTDTIPIHRESRE